MSTLLARFPILEKLRNAPKPLLLGIAAMAVALVIAAAIWGREPEYKVLFSNIEDRDGGAIVTALGTMNVPYRFGSNGSAILVPPDRVYDARLQLAAQGLPRGGSVGFELLDQSRFGASQFSEQISYQRALEGELARSVEAVNAVQRARVHLALPRQSLFVRERRAPTASVLLNLYPGRSMSDAQVAAITWLIASSVPELTAENISVVDQNGRLLSTPAADGTHCGSGGPHRLYLHPADLELIRLHLQEELTDAHWRLFADETITRGGCRAQTPHGEIDAQLETRWRRIAAALNRDSVWNTP